MDALEVWLPHSLKLIMWHFQVASLVLLVLEMQPTLLWGIWLQLENF